MWTAAAVADANTSSAPCARHTCCVRRLTRDWKTSLLALLMNSLPSSVATVGLRMTRDIWTGPQLCAALTCEPVLVHRVRALVRDYPGPVCGQARAARQDPWSAGAGGARGQILGEDAPEGVPGHLLAGWKVAEPEHAQLWVPQDGVAPLHGSGGVGKGGCVMASSIAAAQPGLAGTTCWCPAFMPTGHLRPSEQLLHGPYRLRACDQAGRSHA